VSSWNSKVRSPVLGLPGFSRLETAGFAIKA
jgi:hypothetical protein